MSESGELGLPPTIDEVRARIFYLACDVEPVSRPAAMLLRAVAESIDDATDAAAEAGAPVGVANGLEAALSQVSGVHGLNSRARDGAPLRFGVVSSQSAYKR